MLNCATPTAWGINAPAARVADKVLGPALVVRDNQASGRQDSAPGFGVITDNRSSWEGFAGFTAPAGEFRMHGFKHVYPLSAFCKKQPYQTSRPGKVHSCRRAWGFGIRTPGPRRCVRCLW